LTPPPPLRVSGRGIGTVYLSLPIGGFSLARQKFLESINALRDRHSHRELRNPSFLLLTGQADFAARIDVNDFRSVVELGFPTHEDRSPSVYNWVSSVEYDGSNAPRPQIRIPIAQQIREVFPAAPVSQSDEPLMHFIVHARVLRSFYSSKPVEAEATLVQRIRDLFYGVASLSIETSLGWSDLIVSGGVPADGFPDLLRRLIAFNTFKAGTSESDTRPLFTRTLTLFGYEWDESHNRIPRVSADVKALIFVRSRYGRLHETKELIENSIRGAWVHVTDGKLDLVGEVPYIRKSFFLEHAKIAEEQIGEDLIQKMETHLLFGQRDDANDHAVILPQLKLEKCNCATALPPVRLVNMTETLEHALRNVYFLFQSALSDPTNCCDMRPAILACDNSLQRYLIGRLGRAKLKRAQSVARIDANPDEASGERLAAEEELKRHAVPVGALQRKIETWVLICERVMRQRTIGSFDELLGQSDRALFYRGGAQKMLFLADCLMNDFYAIAAPRMLYQQAEGHVSTTLPTFTFATLYDAVERIESVIGTGFVRVPARNIFKLVAVIPDLWHEVGVHIYFQKRLRDGLHINNPRDRAIWIDLGDHFGDLVVWIYGFDCDFESFAISILQSWRESVATDEPEPMREVLFASVLVRLMFVMNVRISLIAPRARVTAEELEGTVSGIVRKHFDKAPLTNKVRQEATASWNSDVYREKFGELGKLVKSIDVKQRVAELKPQARTFDDALTSFEESENLNQVFCQLYSEIQRTRKSVGERAQNDFARMAALGRSAVLEYHRRLRPIEKQPTAFERDFERGFPEFPVQE